MRRLVVACCLTAVVAACSGEKKSELGTAAGNLAGDTQMLKPAQDAANAVIRAGGDCDAVKAALPAAYRELQRTEARVKSPTGQQVLETLHKQVDAAAQGCP